MLCYLMHKDVVVAEVKIGSNYSFIDVKFLNMEHCPIGGETKSKLRKWWAARGVPDSRDYLRYLINRGIVANSNHLQLKNLGLSLTDCYWIKPVNSSYCWDDVSLYKNAFKDQTSNISCSIHSEDAKLSPGCSGGDLGKSWVRSNGQIYLVKSNYSKKLQQQSFNEVFSTMLIKALRESNKWVLPSVDYSIMPIKIENRQGADLNMYGCICKAYTAEDLEEVSLRNIKVSRDATRVPNLYEWFVGECVVHGLNENYVRAYLNQEIQIDYILSNSDRHNSNISILRNPDTFQWVGFSPAYDFGSSMFIMNDSKSIPTDTHVLDTLESRSFEPTEKKLLSHVRDCDRLNIDLLYNEVTFKEFYYKDAMKSRTFYDKLYKNFVFKMDRMKVLLKY